jgi:Ca-activated chloride channel family protein
VSGLSLQHPIVFAAAAAALALAHLVGGRRAGTAVAWHAWPRWLDGLPVGARGRAAPWLARARLVALLALAFAVCGPRARFEERTTTRRGVDLAVLLDASSSMTVAIPGSYATTRFGAARDAVRDFVAGRAEDRVGLSTFARWPRLSCPLTSDHELFGARLDAAQPVESGAADDATAIGVALAAGARQVGPKGARARVLVLVTDGANNQGPISPEEGTRLCHDQGIRVYTIALGGGEKFGSGAAPVDARLLAEIAEATGGRTFAARDAAGLADAMRTIDALERAPLQVALDMREASIAPPFVAWLLLAGAALVLFERTWGRVLP